MTRIFIAGGNRSVTDSTSLLDCVQQKVRNIADGSIYMPCMLGAAVSQTDIIWTDSKLKRKTSAALRGVKMRGRGPAAMFFSVQRQFRRNTLLLLGQSLQLAPRGGV